MQKKPRELTGASTEYSSEIAIESMNQCLPIYHYMSIQKVHKVIISMVNP